MGRNNNNRSSNRSGNASSSKEKENYTKHSGCGSRDHYISKGVKIQALCVWGWKYDKQNGKRKFVSVPAHDAETKSDRWKKMVTTVTRADGSTFLTNTLWDMEKKRLKFTDMSMVANPSARDGGYWGPGGYDMDIRN